MAKSVTFIFLNQKLVHLSILSGSYYDIFGFIGRNPFILGSKYELFVARVWSKLWLPPPNFS